MTLLDFLRLFTYNSEFFITLAFLCDDDESDDDYYFVIEDINVTDLFLLKDYFNYFIYFVHFITPPHSSKPLMYIILSKKEEKSLPV